VRVSAEGAVEVVVQAQVDDRVSTLPLLHRTVVAWVETQPAFSVQQKQLAAPVALKDAHSGGLLDAAAVIRSEKDARRHAQRSDAYLQHARAWW
jgi:hypothetical protein